MIIRGVEVNFDARRLSDAKRFDAALKKFGRGFSDKKLYSLADYFKMMDFIIELVGSDTALALAPTEYLDDIFFAAFELITRCTEQLNEAQRAIEGNEEEFEEVNDER